MEAALLVVLGFLLGLVPQWAIRSRRLATHWAALFAELEQCEPKLKNLLKDNVQAPLYRMPVMAYEASYLTLLSDGDVSANDVKVLGEVYGLIQDLNRGLEYASDMSHSGSSHQLKAEFQRNILKAKHLVEPDDSGATKIDQARVLIDEKMHRKWWKVAVT